MKKFLFLVCAAGLLTACDKDKNKQTSVLNGGAISIEEAVISPVGSEVSFALTTDAAWKVYDKPDWLILSKTEGRSGTTSLVMSAEMNRTYENRECAIRFETIDRNFSESVAVSQEYPYVELSREEITFRWNQCEEFETAAETINLHCNTDWTMARELANLVEKQEDDAEKPSAEYPLSRIEDAVTDEWMAYSASEGSGDAELSFNPVSYNISREPRKMTLKLSGALDSYKIVLIQENLRFLVDQEELQYEALDTRQIDLTVDSESPWVVANSPAWIVLDKREGSDITTLSVSVDGANPTREARSGEIVLLCDAGAQRIIKVSQKGYIFGVSPLEFNLANADMSDKSLTVASSGDWEALQVPEWVVLSAASGTGNEAGEALTLKAAGQNLELTDRTASIEFRSKHNALSEHVSVKQDAFIFTANAANTQLPTLSTDKYNLTIRCSGTWQVSSSESWMEFSQTSGSGDATVTYNAKTANTDENPRKTTITVTSLLNGLKKTFEITQRGYVFTVAPETFRYPTLPTDRCTVSIECSATWTVSSKPDWIQASAMSGTGDATVTLSADNNFLASERTGKVQFSSAYNGTTKVLEVAVSQDKFSFSVSESSFAVPVITSGSYVVSVECSAGWTVTGVPAWIKAAPLSHTGNSTVTFQVESNGELSPRSASVKVNSTLSGDSREIAFSQPAFEFDSSPASFSYEAINKASNTVPVVCSGVWTVVNAPSWANVSPLAGSGNATLTVAPAYNVTTSERSSSFVVRSTLNGLEKSVSITQAPFVFDSASESFSFEALNTQISTVNVTCMEGWTVENAQVWMGLSATSGSGDATISICPANNVETKSRSGVVQIVSTLNSSLKKAVTITQQAFEFNETAVSVSFETLDVAASEITVTGMGAWTVQDAPSWLTVTPTSGSGNGRISITPTQNLDTKPRTATLNVVSSLNTGLKKPVTVSQKAFEFDSTSKELSFDALSTAVQTVPVVCMSGWSVRNVPSWITVTPGSGSGDGSVSVRVENNTATSARNATLQIVSDLNPALVKEVVVSQKAFEFDPKGEELSFGALSTESRTVSVVCMSGWNVQNTTPWITVTPGSGSDNGSVSVMVGNNTATSARNATFRIVSDLNPSLVKEVVVSQNAFEFDSKGEELSFDALSTAAQTVPVVCMSGWTVQNAPAWITVTPNSGTGNGSLSVSVGNNTTLAARNATFRIVSDLDPSLVKEVAVSQKAFEFDSTGEELSFDALGASAKNVSVVCMGAWSVQNVPSWVTVTPDRGSGNQTLSIVPSGNNTGTASRSVTLSVASALAPSLTKSVTVTQNAYPFSVTPSEVPIAAESTEPVAIRVECPGGWSAECPESWVHISDGSGSGNGTFTVNTVGANPGTAARTAEVRVVSTVDKTVYRTVRVEQSGAVDNPENNS